MMNSVLNAVERLTIEIRIKPFDWYGISIKAYWSDSMTENGRAGAILMFAGPIHVALRTRTGDDMLKAKMATPINSKVATKRKE